MSETPETLDARGLRCPLPVLKARKRLKSLAEGEALRVLADDPASVIDVPHFCNEQGHTLESRGEEDGALIFTIRKGG